MDLLLSLLLLASPDDARNARGPDPDTRFEMPRYTRASWERRRERLRLQILSAAGLLPAPARGKLHARATGTQRIAGVRVENVLLETLSGYFVGGNLYRPLRPHRRLPAVLIPHGHWKQGRLEHREDYSVPALAINLARQGYVVFAHDMTGYNDTRQTSHDFQGWRMDLWSFNPMGLQLWNSIRALDYVQSLSDVDPARIGVTGASGGGTQTFLLAAVDSRVRVSAPVNMVSAHMQGKDPCEEAPGLRTHGAFNVEFAAMMAPRPTLIVSSMGDWTKNTPRVEFPAILSVYRLFGAAGMAANAHIDAEHNYNRESRTAVYPFFARVLRPPWPGLAEIAFDMGETDRWRALPEGRLPEGAVSEEVLFGNWIAASQLRTSLARPRDLRVALTAALGVEWPDRVERRGDFLIRPGAGDRVPIVASGAVRVGDLFIDPFQTGSARAPRDRGGRWFLGYNLSDDAHRVQDILTALAWTGGAKPRLECREPAAVWCLFAAAVAPVAVDLRADLDGFQGSDEEFRRRLNVPGIQRAGGLSAALRLSTRSRAVSRRSSPASGPASAASSPHASQ